MENIDPMGVHTGESAAAPAQFSTQTQELETKHSLIRELNIKGGCNVVCIQPIHQGDLCETTTVESPCLLQTEYPIARMAAKLQ